MYILLACGDDENRYLFIDNPFTLFYMKTICFEVS